MRSGDESQACGQPRACGQPNTQEKAESEALLAIRAYWSNTDNFTPEDEAPRAESPHDQHQRMDNNAYPRYTTLIGHRLGVTHISHATGDPNKLGGARARPTEMPMGLSPSKRQVEQSNASRERISSARRGGGHGYLLNPQAAQRRDLVRLD